jgi:replicative DNA helicase
MAAAWMTHSNSEQTSVSHSLLGRYPVEGCGVWVVDDASLSAAAIRAKAQRFRREFGGLDVLMVDYLGLMGGESLRLKLGVTCK